LKVLSF